MGVYPVSSVRKMVTGQMAQKIGALPKVELPGDNARLKECVKETLSYIAGKGLYRRDGVLVLVYEKKRRLETMKPDAFRSWVETYIAYYKIRIDDKKVPRDVIKTLPREFAVGIMESWDFWPNIQEIQRIVSVRLPMRGANGIGDVVLMPVGYSEAHKTLTYANPE